MSIYTARQTKDGTSGSQEAACSHMPFTSCITTLLLIFQTDKGKLRERWKRGHQQVQPKKAASAAVPLEKPDFNGQALLRRRELCVSWGVTYFPSASMNSASVLSLSS